jgi:hypothetical protein
VLEDPALRKHLTATIAGALPPGYVLDREGDERHGSWEWMASRHANGVTRVLVAAVTDLATWDSPVRVLLDIWAAAEADERFTRFPVRHLELSLEVRNTCFNLLAALFPKV